MDATYNPAIFDVDSLDAAKQIILTDGTDMTSAERWERETPYLLGLISDGVGLSPDSLVLDYGCGVGRMSKAIIDGFGCRVVGVDISASMRAFAAHYVNDSRFFACAPEALKTIGCSRFDAAISVWVLQHCAQPDQDARRIEMALRPTRPLFVVNELRRFVPTLEAVWLNDGIDVQDMLGRHMKKTAGGALDPDRVGRGTAAAAWWGTFRV